MRVIVGFQAIALGLALTVTGCAVPPAAEVDAAKAAVDKAATDRADQYAAESLKVAQEARAALDAELTVQDGKWFKSYRQDEGACHRGEGGGRQGRSRCRRRQGEGYAVAAKSDCRCRGAAKAKAAAVRVGGKIEPPIKMNDVNPVYPAIAQERGRHRRGHHRSDDRARRQGHRRDRAALGPDARSGRTGCRAPVRYQPTLLNGVAVPVVMTVTINFKK